MARTKRFTCPRCGQRAHSAFYTELRFCDRCQQRFDAQGQPWQFPSCPEGLPPELLEAAQAMCQQQAHVDELGSLLDPQRLCAAYGVPWAIGRIAWRGLAMLVEQRAAASFAAEDAKDLAADAAWPARQEEGTS